MLERILICTITHSRPKCLTKLLSELSKQKVKDSIAWDICIVDNDCTGKNQEVVQGFSNFMNRIHVIEEPRKGIVYARNTGVDFFLQDTYQALVFIDDDEWPAQTDWLQRLIDTQRETNSDIVTSHIQLHPETEKISWVKNAMGYQSPKEDIKEVKKFYTNNTLILRHVLETVQPAFDERFAYTGSSDLHFSLKCHAAGYKASFVKDAEVIELFFESRATLKWFLLRGFRNGSGATRSDLFVNTGVKQIARIFGMSILRLGRGCATLFLSLLKFDRGLMCLGAMRCAASLGTIAGIWGIKYNEYLKLHGN